MKREHSLNQGSGGRVSAGALPIQREHAGKQTLTEAISPAQARGGGPAAAPAAGAGAALPAQVRSRMEGAFGTSFADVRIHQGEQAAAMDAVAYTQGNDIHFQPGSYDPSSPAGQELLGHELTHVVQQRQGRVAAPGQGKSGAINADAGLEAEADLEGARAARGDAVSAHVRASTGHAAAGVVQRRMIQLGNTGAHAQVDTNHLGMTPEQLRGHLDDPTLPPGSRRPLERAEHDMVREPQTALAGQAVVAQFVANFDAAMAAYPSVALGAGIQAKVTALVTALHNEGVTDLRFEDYATAVFGMGSIQLALMQLEHALAGGGGPPPVIAANDLARGRDLVADALLACTLTPSKEHNRKFLGNFSSYFSRYAIEVLSPASTARAITAVRHKLADPIDKDVHNSAHFADTGLADADTHSARMLKLSLLNTTAVVRQALGLDQLWADIMASGHIAQLMIASSGAEEQYFLSTCPLASRNADMSSHAATIAVLLAAGRNLAQGLLADVDHPGNLAAAQHNLTWYEQAGDLVHRRVAEATAEFTAIDNAARAQIASGALDEGRLKEMKQRWSRTMQKLGAVLNWKDPDELPQLSKKVVKDHWHGSTVPAMAYGLTAGLLNPHARTGQRFTAPDAAEYDQQTSQAMNPSSNGGDVVVTARLAAGRTPQQFWDRTLEAGGTPISMPSHALYMKAILRNSVKVFAVNDPMERAYQYYTFPEWVEFVTHQQITVPASVAP
jgi:hypothetical protein